ARESNYDVTLRVHGQARHVIKFWGAGRICIVNPASVGQNRFVKIDVRFVPRHGQSIRWVSRWIIIITRVVYSDLVGGPQVFYPANSSNHGRSEPVCDQEAGIYWVRAPKLRGSP